jgi:hypothetical protein
LNLKPVSVPVERSLVMKPYSAHTQLWLTMVAVGLGVTALALPSLRAQIPAPAGEAKVIDSLFPDRPAADRPATTATQATPATAFTDSFLDAPRRDRNSNDPFAGPQIAGTNERGVTIDGRAVARENRQAEVNARRVQDQIRRAVAAIRNAADEVQKSRETKQLSDLLNEYFETDVRRRESELTQIEERVKKLREQLDLRRQKKQEILDLQMKVALNEADGLGFFSAPSDLQSRYTEYFEQVEPRPGMIMPPGSRDIAVPPAPAMPPGARGGRNRGRTRDGGGRDQPAAPTPAPLDDLFGPSTQPAPASPPIR